MTNRISLTTRAHRLAGHIGHRGVRASLLAALIASSATAFGASDGNDQNQPRSNGRGSAMGVPAALPRPISGITPGSGTPLSRRRAPAESSGQPQPNSGGAPNPRPPIVVHPGLGGSGNWTHGTGFGSGFWFGSGGVTGESSSLSSDWRFYAHLHAPAIVSARRHFWWRYPYWGHTHWCWWNDWRYSIGGAWDYADPWLLAQAQQTYDQQQRQIAADERAEAERFDRLTDLEKANELMLVGPREASRAVGFYVKHLDAAPEDADAMRLLAVALIRSGKPDQASAMMSMAYGKRPILAHQPLDRARLSTGTVEFRDYVTDSVNFAHRSKTASAWLTVAVLMHAEGRLEHARAMLAKAKAAGLSRSVLSEMELALAKK